MWKNVLRRYRWTLICLISLLGLTAIAWGVPPDIKRSALGWEIKVVTIAMSGYYIALIVWVHWRANRKAKNIKPRCCASI